MIPAAESLQHFPSTYTLERCAYKAEDVEPGAPLGQADTRYRATLKLAATDDTAGVVVRRTTLIAATAFLYLPFLDRAFHCLYFTVGQRTFGPLQAPTDCLPASPRSTGPQTTSAILDPSTYAVTPPHRRNAFIKTLDKRAGLRRASNLLQYS